MRLLDNLIMLRQYPERKNRNPWNGPSLKVSVFKPDWEKYGRGAGPVRNKEMYKYALEDEPMVIAFWDGESKGTKSMIDIATKDGAKVHVVEI